MLCSLAISVLGGRSALSSVQGRASRARAAGLSLVATMTADSGTLATVSWPAVAMLDSGIAHTLAALTMQAQIALVDELLVRQEQCRRTSK